MFESDQFASFTVHCRQHADDVTAAADDVTVVIGQPWPAVRTLDATLQLRHHGRR